MKLQVIKRADLEKPVRATVQTTGKLGFTSEAAVKLELSEGKSIVFSQDTEDNNALYLRVSPVAVDDGFRVNKAGAYFYLSAKPLFDTLKYDYAKKSIAIDLTKVVIEGVIYYKCVRRVGKMVQEKQLESDQ